MSGTIEYKMRANALFNNKDGIPEFGSIFDVDSFDKIRDPHFSSNALHNVRVVTEIIKNLPDKKHNGIYIHAEKHYKSCVECKKAIDKALSIGKYKKPKTPMLPF